MTHSVVFDTLKRRLILEAQCIFLPYFEYVHVPTHPKFRFDMGY